MWKLPCYANEPGVGLFIDIKYLCFVVNKLECVSKFNVSTNEIRCKIDHEGFRSDCLDVWFYTMHILTITAIVKQKKTTNS